MLFTVQQMIAIQVHMCVSGKCLVLHQGGGCMLKKLAWICDKGLNWPSVECVLDCHNIALPIP